MIRAFVAIPLPNAARDALETVQEAVPCGRQVAPENFHITLAYLDKQTPQVLERVHEVLAQIRMPVITISVHGLGIFGDRDPRLVYAGIETDSALERLRDKVRRAAMRGDVELPRARFRPHVTLARFKGRMSPRNRAQLDALLAEHVTTPQLSFEADRFVMYQSTRHQAGATHDPMVEYMLAG